MCTPAPSGLQTIRLPSAPTATVPPPVTPDGSWPAHHELPLEVETPMWEMPASPEPTRTIVAGVFSAKSMPLTEP